jgi:hypothetical protein
VKVIQITKAEIDGKQFWLIATNKGITNKGTKWYECETREIKTTVNR